jgi:O-antigen/teichoic acid export membrane protein
VLSGSIALTLMAIAATRIVSGLGERTRGAAPPIAHWVRYARIMYFNGLLSSAIGHLDRFIIGAAIGTHGVATLMVVRQLHQLPTVFHQMFLTVVAPMFVAAAGDPVGAPRRQALYDMMTDWVMRLALPLILFLAVFGGSLLSLYGAEFSANGTPLLLLCCVAVLANLALGPIGNLMNMSGLEAPLLRLIIMSICLMIGAYVLFIPLVGLPGVGLGLIVSTLFLNISALRLARRRLGLSWWSTRFVAWIVPGLLALAALLALRAALGWSGHLSPAWLIAGLAAAYGCMVAGNALLGFHADDRAAFEAIRAKFSLAYCRPGASS